MPPNDRKPESPILLPILVIIPFLTGSIADIDRRITSLVNSFTLYPRTHSERMDCVDNLAKEWLSRYRLSGEKQDCDNAILHYTEAILLLPVSRAEHLGNVVRHLFNLAIALLERFEEFGQPEDIKFSVEYLRYLRGMACDPFGVPRDDVTKSLIQALYLRVKKSDTGVGTRNIKEMMVLCRELLIPDLSADFPIAASHFLSEAIWT